MTLLRPVLATLMAWCLVGCGEDVFSLDEREGQSDDPEYEPCNGEYGLTWYVREDGGDRYQCTGRSDAPYPGSGILQSCAFSHPFYVLPPGDEPLMGRGDRLIISQGEYLMGAVEPWNEYLDHCDPDYPWDCAAAAIPSGDEEEAPTCILGEGWDDGCDEISVRLSAVHGASHVLSLEDSSHVRIQCLEITDGSECIVDHPELPCPPWPELPDPQAGVDGIFGAETEHVTLQNLWIHGMPRNGILGEGWNAGWDLEDLRVTNNGWTGISFPSDGESDTTHQEMSLTRVTASWNGCGEWLEEPGSATLCWDFSDEDFDGGFGVDSWYSRADWFIRDSDFSHNTGAGALITLAGDDVEIWIDRVRAEGNAGPQLELGGNTTIWNSLLLSNCDFHSYYDYPWVTPCKLEGPALAFDADDNADLNLVNSTLYGQIPALLAVYTLEDEDCFDSELVALNNIFVGAGDGGSLIGAAACLDIFQIDVSHNVLFGIEDAYEYCEIDPSNDCTDPLLVEPMPDHANEDLVEGFAPLEESPAIDHGLPVDGELIPDHDFEDNPRPLGEGVDCGAFEIL